MLYSLHSLDYHQAYKVPPHLFTSTSSKHILISMCVDAAVFVLMKAEDGVYSELLN